MLTSEIYFYAKNKQTIVSKVAFKVLEENPSFIYRIAPQEFLSKFPETLIIDYFDNQQNVTSYRLPNGINIWHVPSTKVWRKTPDFMITKRDGEFDEIYGNVLLTGDKDIDGNVQKLSQEQIEFLNTNTLYGHANGKPVFVIKLDLNTIEEEN